MTKSERACSSCGAALPAAVLEGLCPKCVVRLSVTPYLAGGVASPPEDSAAGAGHDPQIAPEPAEALRRFGDYELLEEIARGGMGAVYRARQVSLDRVVALKMVLSGQFASEGEVKRFRAEAGAAAHLDHPHIVPIYEVGEHEGRCFFTMKLIEGPSLAQSMAGGISEAEEKGRKGEKGKEAARADAPILPFSSAPLRSGGRPPPHVGGYGARDTATLVAKVARAVHHAHQRGVLHRDLKPANILLDARGEPYVTDFGLARRMESETLLTQTGATLGTPAYMAPEQAAGEHGITIAVDVWSLGAMLFHLLAGRPPFTGASASDVLLQVRTREAPFPRSLNPAVPADLETICLKCLEKDPQRRYGTAAELADDLERFLRGEPIHARPTTTAERMVMWVKRHPMRAGAALAFLFVLIVGIAGITSQWRRANRHAQATESALRTSQDSLWQANFDRARALRTSGQMGQRVEALKAIAAAAKIRPTLELRNEAIAAMAFTDLEDVGRWFAPPTNAARWTVDSRFELIALESQDGVTEIRGVRDGRLRSMLPVSMRAGNASFSRSGDLFLANDRVRCRLWDWRNTNILVECPGGGAGPILSPNEFWLAYVASPSSVAWLDVRANREAGRLDNLAGPPLSFSLNGELLAIYVKRAIEVWRLADRTRIARLETEGCIHVDWLPGEGFLASGSDVDYLTVWDISADRVQKLAGHKHGGVEPHWHPSGSLLASVAWDNVLRVWDPFAGVQLLETRLGRPRSFSTDGQWLIVGGERGLGWLKVHTPKECRLFHLPLGFNQHFGVKFSPDDQFMAGLSEDGLGIWEVASGRRVAHELLAKDTSLEFTGSRSFVTSGPEGVLLWTNLHPANGWSPMRQAVITLPDKEGMGSTFSADQTRRVTKRGADGEVSDFPSGRLRARLTGQKLFGGAAFSPDGRWLASGYWDNTGGHRSEFWIWSAEDGQPVRKIPMGNSAPFFSPDGRWLLIGSEKEYFQFAISGHPTNWNVVRQYSRDVSGFLVGQAAFSADGKLLAVHADQRVFRLLETATGRELARLTPLPETVGTGGCTFSHNGRWFAAASDTGLHVWDLALIRQRLREMELDWEGPPDLPPPPIARHP